MQNTDTTNPKDLMGMKKPPLHLVPPALTIHVSQAMGHGAYKAGPDKTGYGPYNWRENKVRMTVYIAAAMRHLQSLLDGEDFASDSGVHHAAHAAAGCGIILDALECKCLIDDRPKKGCAADLIDRFTEKKDAPILEKPYTALKQEECPECRFVSVEGKSPYHAWACPLRAMAEKQYKSAQPAPESKLCGCGAPLNSDGKCSAFPYL